MAQNKTQKDFLMKTPLIDFSDHLQSASDDISHHVANIDIYKGALRYQATRDRTL